MHVDNVIVFFVALRFYVKFVLKSSSVLHDIGVMFFLKYANILPPQALDIPRVVSIKYHVVR